MTPQEKPILRCQHIKVNGEQCGSPALRRHRFCYFHDRWRPQRLKLVDGKSTQRLSRIELPVLEDANSIQVAISQTMQLLLTGEIDTKSAGLLLYALQTASANLRHATLNPEPEKVVIQPNQVHSIGLGENAWAPPLPNLEAVSPEEREKLANEMLLRAAMGQDIFNSLKVWARLKGMLSEVGQPGEEVKEDLKVWGFLGQNLDSRVTDIRAPTDTVPGSTTIESGT